MGEGINWAYSNEDGQFILPKGRFRGANAPPQVPVTFRADGFRPVTRVAESEDAVLDVQLELNLASDWIISQCEKAAANRTIGSEMRFTLPPKTAPAESYHDVDYGGEFVTTKIDGKTFSMRTMRGAMCCGGRPLPSRYLNSRNIVERAWTLKANGRVFDEWTAEESLLMEHFGVGSDHFSVNKPNTKTQTSKQPSFLTPFSTRCA